jgi:hypothetical protein
MIRYRWTILDNRVQSKYVKIRKWVGGEENYIMRKLIIPDLHMLLLTCQRREAFKSLLNSNAGGYLKVLNQRGVR